MDEILRLLDLKSKKKDQLIEVIEILLDNIDTITKLNNTNDINKLINLIIKYNKDYEIQYLNNLEILKLKKILIEEYIKSLFE